MEWWSGPAIGLALIVLIAVHVRLTKSSVQEVTRRFWCWCQWEKLNAPTQLQIQQKLRYEKELLRIRLKVFALIQQVAIHVCFAGFFITFEGDEFPDSSFIDAELATICWLYPALIDSIWLC